MKKAIESKNFNDLMTLTMQDSNQFHSICQETYPPLFYLNDFSRKIISLISKINQKTEFKVGYTFDAGPHAVLLVQKPIFDDFFKLIMNITECPEEKYLFHEFLFDLEGFWLKIECKSQGNLEKIGKQAKIQ